MGDYYSTNKLVSGLAGLFRDNYLSTVTSPITGPIYLILCYYVITLKLLVQEGVSKFKTHPLFLSKLCGNKIIH